MTTSGRLGAVIFDLDGVLLDTEPLYTEATQRVVQPFGKEFTWAIKSQLMGKDARVGARIALDALGMDMSEEEFLERRGKHLRELCKQAPAIPGAEAWVATLRGASVPIAVATSSSRALCEIKLLEHPWIASIDPFVCSTDPEVRAAKPAPDIYLEAARRLGVEPGRCLVFEDSPAGVEAGLNAGMTVVALKAEQMPLERMSGAHRVVKSYAEVSLELLDLPVR